MRLVFFCLLLHCSLFVKAQFSNGIILSDSLERNGQLDQIQDFAKRIQVPFTMPDGTILQTDIYLPILQDSFTIDLDIDFLGIHTKLELLPRGFQYITYDSLNGEVNPNPQQLPVILSRTPYRKGGDSEIGSAFALLGYMGIIQDMRGRYESEGVYMPLYSDGWNKNPYHPSYGHVLDLTELSDPKNGNKHEDGYNTIEFIKNQLYRDYDLDGDGILETKEKAYNGSIGMFGASALAYNQLQAAAAHPIDPDAPGLKCLFPIVGPLEFYKSTGFQNGVFRDQLVTGWLRGQIVDTKDELMDIDFSMDNNIHTSFDYGTEDKFEASNKAIDHFSTVKYLNGPSGYYPNSMSRRDMDASFAPVNEFGEGDINGQFSRYTNMEVPTFNVAGWYDIFVDGSIETFNLMKHHLSPTKGNKNKQKIVIGPWAHQTISSTVTGDVKYPDNVKDVTRIDLNDFGGDINVAALAQSELISWFRYNLNRNKMANIGEPKIKIPASDKWQKIGNGLEVQFPRTEYILKFVDLINFLTAAKGLEDMPLNIRLFGNVINLNLDLPKLSEPLIEGFESDILEKIPEVDFEETPDVRFYVIGPIDDGIEANEKAGNYWFESDTFPVTENINSKSMYLHQSGVLDFNSPTRDEGYAIYVHDPDDPVYSIGGANMILKTPQGDRDSQGQINLADERYVNYTMDRQGVIQFTSDALRDTMSIIGFTKAKLYAKTNPAEEVSGPTDTDFFVRIVDVYPDGREMFVVEGCVNARARAYAKSLADQKEDINAPFNNIEIGEVYEYYFQLLPIAYTFGVDHKIKVLISSSNYPRYQANPNLPIEEGEFFRRKPSDGQTYEFNGKTMHPRIAVQRLAFSPEHPSQIIFPVLGEHLVSGVETNIGDFAQLFSLYPNPCSEQVKVLSQNNSEYRLEVFSNLGELLYQSNFTKNTDINVKHLPSASYIITLTDPKNNVKYSQTFQKL